MRSLITFETQNHNSFFSHLDGIKKQKEGVSNSLISKILSGTVDGVS